MSTNYKEIKNGRGTTLMIDESTYISVGHDGCDVMLRVSGQVSGFDSLEHLASSICKGRASYYFADE